jgi:hypothetical protein
MEIGFVEFELVRSSRVDRAPATNEVLAKSSSKKRYSTVQYMWWDVLLVLQCTGRFGKVGQVVLTAVVQ